MAEETMIRQRENALCVTNSRQRVFVQIPCSFSADASLSDNSRFLWICERLYNCL